MKQKNDIRREKKTFAMVKKVISTMKKGKAGDKLGQKAQWFIKGGDGMIKGLEILNNRIQQEKIIPKQLQQVIIKSINKKESGEEAICKYGNIKIIMPVFMNNIAAIGDADAIRKRIRNCSKLETEEKNTIWAEKDKIFDNKNRERETGTNRTTGKGRKD